MIQCLYKTEFKKLLKKLSDSNSMITFLRVAISLNGRLMWQNRNDSIKLIFAKNAEDSNY